MKKGFMGFTVHQILFGWSNQEEQGELGM